MSRSLLLNSSPTSGALSLAFGALMPFCAHLKSLFRPSCARQLHFTASSCTARISASVFLTPFCLLSDMAVNSVSCLLFLVLVFLCCNSCMHVCMCRYTFIQHGWFCTCFSPSPSLRSHYLSLSLPLAVVDPCVLCSCTLLYCFFGLVFGRGWGAVV